LSQLPDPIWQAAKAGPNVATPGRAIGSGGPVWVIDGQTLFRRAMAALLRQWSPGIQVLDAADFGAALASVKEPPALVLADVGTGGEREPGGLIQLVARFPGVPVVILAAAVDWREAGRAIEAGARGVVPKSATEATLREALDQVLSGRIYLPLEASCRGPDRIEDGGPAGVVGRPAERPGLTRRQQEVLAELALGFSNKEIARSLGLLESTVKVHVKTIFKKLAATNRTQAARLALDMDRARSASA
jgi:two-component system, NarL family, nitrate/nitrite response regulator NarL